MSESQQQQQCHSINDFINNFKGGTRLNRFIVTGNIGPGIQQTNNRVTPYHIRSATLPESAVGPLAINHRGRTVTYPGDRTYLPWQITVLDDHDGTATGNGGSSNLHKMFHDWQSQINNHVSNKTDYPQGSNPSSLFASSWNVQQLQTNGDNALSGRTFTLFNVWPIGVGPIVLDMSQDNVLSSFAVTIVYSHYTYDGAPLFA